MTRIRPLERSALLRKRITESGLSIEKFAHQVLFREDRTVERWLAGDSPIPFRVWTWLQKPWKSPYPTRARRAS